MLVINLLTDYLNEVDTYNELADLNVHSIKVVENVFTVDRDTIREMFENIKNDDKAEINVSL